MPDRTVCESSLSVSRVVELYFDYKPWIYTAGVVSNPSLWFCVIAQCKQRDYIRSMKYRALIAFVLSLSASAHAGSKSSALDGELLEAAVSGSANRVLSVLQEGADLRAQNHAGKTALHLAIQYQQSEVVQILIRAGASGALRDSRSHTPVHFAAIYCQSEVIAQLFRRSPKLDINTRNGSGKTAIILAAEHGCAKAFLTLLQIGGDAIDLDAVDENLRDVDSYVFDNYLQGFLDRARMVRKNRPNIRR